MAGADATAHFNYGWNLGAVPPAAPGPSLSGRVLLTPQATDVFVARLEAQIAHLQDMAAADPADTHLPVEIAALQGALQYMAKADVLAQSLGDFNDALLEQVQRTFSPAADPTVMPFLAPATAPRFEPRTIPNPASGAFTPLRGGHFRFDQLQIVDAFGQVYDMLAAFGPNSAAFTPTRAPDMVTSGDTNYQVLELKPRISQPARLALDWLDAREDARVVGVDASADPVCGWVMVNHVDDSLLIYAADGTFEGELLDVGSLTGPGRTAHWLPPADRDPPPAGTPPTIANQHLADFVNGLLAAPAGQSALAQLIGLANASAWAIDPTGGWDDQELPLLVGRPLALVRARAQLELYGRAADSQAWADTGQDVTGGFETLSFPVQLGSAELLDDGLVAYFRDDAYATCYSPYVPAQVSSGYALPAASGTALTLQPSGPGVAPAAGQTRYLTLLMAPEAKVHALTGVLPALGVRLPASCAKPNLSKLAITFRSGPVLADPAVPAIDLPALQVGSWAWLQRQVPATRAQAGTVAKADQVARLPDRPAALREGWLRLMLAGGTQLTYALDQPSVTCSGPGAPNTVLLRVTIYNGTQQPVACNAIALTLPVGGDATALTPDASTIVASVVLGDKAMKPWLCTLAPDGELRLVPGDALPPGQTVSLLLANVQVNAAPGTAQLAIAEEGATGTISLVLPLVKTPPLAAPAR
jgi:hypothetical protein